MTQVDASAVVEGIILPHDDLHYDNSYNAIWESEISIFDQGWIVEIAIPFSMLKFRKSDEYIWGVNFTRYIHRKNELIIPNNASGSPALFKKFENIVAPNNNANNLAANKDASLKTLR